LHSFAFSLAAKLSTWSVRRNGATSGRDYELDVEEKHEKTCPSCQEVVDEKVVVCVRCGYNFQTGEKTRSDVSEKKAKPKRRFLFWHWGGKSKPAAKKKPPQSEAGPNPSSPGRKPK